MAAQTVMSVSKSVRAGVQQVQDRLSRELDRQVTVNEALQHLLRLDEQATQAATP